MIVVDASAMVEVLKRTSAGEAVEERLFQRGETLHAPHLLDIEVTHALRRIVRVGDMTAERGRAALSILGRFPLERYSHRLLLPRIWELRGNATAYDAAYVALAEVLRATLVTRDAAMAEIPGHTATVEFVA